MTESSGLSYHYPRGIDARHFTLTGQCMSIEQRKVALGQINTYVNDLRRSFLGYQSNAQLDANELLRSFPFLASAINNIGDSFANPTLTGRGSALADGYFSLNCKWVERAVLDYFAARWGEGLAPRLVAEDRQPNWEDRYWGYILSMGSTEGNLMALRSARDYLKGRRLLFEPSKPIGEQLHYEECVDTAASSSAFNPVLLMSSASHYSVAKLAQMLEIETRLVPTDIHERMRVPDLCRIVEGILRDEGRPIAISFNYGTTWTGALDDVEAATRELAGIFKRYGMDRREVRHADGTTCWRHGYWFHVDGALGAGYATYTKRDADGTALPRFDFSTGVQSLAMSGHKWPGAPWPTGIYMTRNRYMMTNDVPEYVGSLDSTLAGSRSGLAAIYLWDWIARSSDIDKKAEADARLRLASWAMAQLSADDLRHYEPARAPGSLMVTFKRPSDRIVRKYALASTATRSHIVCMPHVKQPLVEQLLAELRGESQGLEAHELARFDDQRGGW